MSLSRKVTGREFQRHGPATEKLPFPRRVRVLLCHTSRHQPIAVIGGRCRSRADNLRGAAPQRIRCERTLSLHGSIVVPRYLHTAFVVIIPPTCTRCSSNKSIYQSFSLPSATSKHLIPLHQTIVYSWTGHQTQASFSSTTGLRLWLN